MKKEKNEKKKGAPHSYPQLRGLRYTPSVLRWSDAPPPKRWKHRAMLGIPGEPSQGTPHEQPSGQAVLGPGLPLHWTSWTQIVSEEAPKALEKERPLTTIQHRTLPQIGWASFVCGHLGISQLLQVRRNDFVHVSSTRKTAAYVHRTCPS